MRKVSNSSHKIEHFLSKAVSSYNRGFARAFNFECEGKRFRGQDCKDVVLEDGKLSFKVGDKSFTVKVSEIVRYKRLRTKKYLFYFGKAEATQKAEKKTAEKKTSKKSTKSKEDKE